MDMQWSTNNGVYHSHLYLICPIAMFDYPEEELTCSCKLQFLAKQRKRQEDAEWANSYVRILSGAPGLHGFASVCS
jgi:predicted nucleic acid-binding Zn ribbon protein